MDELWTVELHSHTEYSRDSRTALETVIETCRVKGIDRIAITDHNTANGALKLQQMAPELVIVGEEIMTTEGEILAFFVKETIPAKLTPNETIRRLRDQGAVISVSHPYDRFRKGAWEEDQLLRIVDQVDALEVFNSRCLIPEDNLKALLFAQKYGKLGTVGSDAHIPYELGHAVLKMRPFVSPEEFLISLRTVVPVTTLSPFWVHGFSSIAKWQRKYLGIPQPS
ncbi:MAG: PHP domain-containing protein [Anaerolineae bacterium]|nr:PHP domain-containing protein [Anaerolineae bacterium]